MLPCAISLYNVQFRPNAVKPVGAAPLGLYDVPVREQLAKVLGSINITEMK